MISYTELGGEWGQVTHLRLGIRLRRSAPAAVLSLVRRASAHAQRNIAWRLMFTGKERNPETGEANGNDSFGATKLARKILGEEPSKRLGGMCERGRAD